MKTTIPTYVMPPTRKQKRDAVYGIYNDLTAGAKETLREVTDEQLHTLIAETMQFMDPPGGLEEVTVSTDAMKQIALFAAQSATGQLLERTK